MLVLVFALLDKLISPAGLSVVWILGTLLVSLLFLVAGIILERGNKMNQGTPLLLLSAYCMILFSAVFGWSKYRKAKEKDRQDAMRPILRQIQQAKEAKENQDPVASHI